MFIQEYCEHSQWEDHAFIAQSKIAIIVRRSACPPPPSLLLSFALFAAPLLLRCFGLRLSPWALGFHSFHYVPRRPRPQAPPRFWPPAPPPPLPLTPKILMICLILTKELVTLFVTPPLASLPPSPTFVTLSVGLDWRLGTAGRAFLRWDTLMTDTLPPFVLLTRSLTCTTSSRCRKPTAVKLILMR